MGQIFTSIVKFVEKLCEKVMKVFNLEGDGPFTSRLFTLPPETQKDMPEYPRVLMYVVS